MPKQRISFLINTAWNEEAIIGASNSSRDWESGEQPTKDLRLAVRRLIEQRLKILSLSNLEIEDQYGN